MRIVDEAARAQAFAGVSEAYERARPTTPVAAVRWLLGPRALDVVDLGEREQRLAWVGRLWDEHPDLGGTSPVAMTYRTQACRVRLHR